MIDILYPKYPDIPVTITLHDASIACSAGWPRINAGFHSYLFNTLLETGSEYFTQSSEIWPVIRVRSPALQQSTIAGTDRGTSPHFTSLSLSLSVSLSFSLSLSLSLSLFRKEFMPSKSQYFV